MTNFYFPLFEIKELLIPSARSLEFSVVVVVVFNGCVMLSFRKKTCLIAMTISTTEIVYPHCY